MTTTMKMSKNKKNHDFENVPSVDIVLPTESSIINDHNELSVDIQNGVSVDRSRAQSVDNQSNFSRSKHLRRLLKSDFNFKSR